MRKNTVKDFWLKVEKLGDDDCWNWKASTIRDYGQFRFNGKKRRANRLAYEFTFGSIPDGMFICHHCDNPLCCNPKHLFLGTHEDNMLDKISKGRCSSGKNHGMYGSTLIKGENNPKAKITQEIADQIRKEYSTENILQKDLAIKYKLSYSQINAILSRRCWK